MNKMIKNIGVVAITGLLTCAGTILVTKDINKKDLDSKNEEIRQLETNLKENRERLSCLEEEHTSINKKSSVLSKENKSLKEKINDLEKENKELKKNQ